MYELNILDAKVQIKMIKTRPTIKKQITPAEKFFFEKSLELLSKQTLDTYRLRINSPKKILFELISVIDNVKKGSLREIYAEILCKEAMQLFNQENELHFRAVTKGFFMSLLATKKFDDIFYSANLIVSDNKDYTMELFNKINNEISTVNGLATFTHHHFKNLSRFIEIFYIELKRYGYNKQYLFNFVNAVFGGNKGIATFQDGMSTIKSLIDRPAESFKIFIGFKYSGIAEELLGVDSFDLKFIPRKEIEQIAVKINDKFLSFLKDNPNHEFYCIDQVAIDYYSAGVLARKKIQKAFDMLFVATDDDIFNIHPMCFVYGDRQPHKGKAQNLSYKLDGHVVPNLDTYKEFITKYKSVPQAQLDLLTSKKIYSTLRYLRHGTLSSEQEHKLLNYWIAIEYLFSSANAEEKKTDRLNEFFKKIHSNSYVRRLFFDLHNSLKVFKIEHAISKFQNDSLDYLLESSTEQEIDQYKNRYPLLYFRFHQTKERFKDAKSILDHLKRHANIISWNLTRIYRTRNEIVHSAATDMEVVELAAHLKYFLIFTVNALFDFILNSPIEMGDEKKLSIDDFFLIESIKYDSIINNDKISVIDLMNIPSPIDYLQRM